MNHIRDLSVIPSRSSVEMILALDTMSNAAEFEVGDMPVVA